MDLIYKNSEGEEINLSKYPYWISTKGLFDSNWNYQSIDTVNGNYITSFKKEIRDIDLQFNVHSYNKREYREALEKFFAITEKDVLLLKPGRITLPNGEYMICYITDNTHSLLNRRINANSRTIKITAENPFWCNDINFSFVSSRHDPNPSYKYLDYPYDMKYDYRASKTIQIVTNAVGASDFKMIIYGRITNPQIYIGDNFHTIDYIIDDDEHMIVDSREKTIMLYKNNGQSINLFPHRNKENNIFEKIPYGTSQVISNCFLDLTIYQERSEPVWTSLSQI